MADELIPTAPGENPEERTSRKRRKSRPNERATDEQEPERPASADRRAPRMPDLLELVGQLQQLSGLVTLGLLAPAQANLVFRSISKTIDIVLRSQTAPQAAATQSGLADACRQNPSLIGLFEPFLTQEQLEQLLRQVNDDAT